MDPGVKSQLSSIAGWHGLNNPWVPEDDADVDYVYVDLRRNPEKYTGGERTHTHTNTHTELVYWSCCPAGFFGVVVAGWVFRCRGCWVSWG
jgi:hypothetical protein